MHTLATYTRLHEEHQSREDEGGRGGFG